MPSISADEAPRLMPFLTLAAHLGAFAGQLTEQGIEEIEYEGEVSRLNTRPLTAAALAGVMCPLIPDVNLVLAPWC